MHKQNRIDSCYWRSPPNMTHGSFLKRRLLLNCLKAPLLRATVPGRAPKHAGAAEQLHQQSYGPVRSCVLRFTAWWRFSNDQHVSSSVRTPKCRCFIRYYSALKWIRLNWSLTLCTRLMWASWGCVREGSCVCVARVVHAGPIIVLGPFIPVYCAKVHPVYHVPSWETILQQQLGLWLKQAGRAT